MADTVAAPIEQQVNGVEGMMYMSSQCTNDGTYNLTVTFKLGTSLDMAQVLVQNRVSQALPTLPDVVKATGVTVQETLAEHFAGRQPVFGRRTPTRSSLTSISSTCRTIATIQVRDELARIDGVGDVSLLGQQDYSMRVWLDPNRLASRNLTAGDIVAFAARAERAGGRRATRAAAGALGRRFSVHDDHAGPAARAGAIRRHHHQDRRRRAKSRDSKDVARIELGAKNQDIALPARRPAVGRPGDVSVARLQRPGRRPNAFKRKMEELQASGFSQGLEYAIVYDTTPFVRESVAEVFKTLRDAVILVAIVVLLFLQDWEA